MNFLFLFLMSLLSLSNVEIKWKETELIIPVYSDIEEYLDLPTAYLYVNGVLIDVKFSYYYGVEGTSISTINTDCVGKYQIIYRIVNEEYDIDELKKINFYVCDITKPVYISPPMNFDVLVNTMKPNYLEGVYYKDDYSYEEEITLVVDDSLVDITCVGKYVVKYLLTDTSNNTLYCERYVNVYDDTIPYFEFTTDLYIPYGVDDYNYLNGVKAIDYYDGDISDSIIVDSSDVIYSKVGAYKVKYYATDSCGNTGFKEKVIKVIDTKEPNIILNCYHMNVDIDYELYDTFIIDNILKIEDNYEKIDVSNVQYKTNYTNQYGSYYIKYYVYDSAFNYSEVNMIINVKDTQLPQIQGDSQNLQLGALFDPYLYVEAHDNIDGDITSKIIIEENDVNMNLEGLYHVLYSVFDSSGNYSSLVLYYNVSKKHLPITTTTTTKDEIPYIPYVPEENNVVEKEKTDYQFLIPIVIIIGVFTFFIINRHKKLK